MPLKRCNCYVWGQAFKGSPHPPHMHSRILSLLTGTAAYGGGHEKVPPPPPPHLHSRILILRILTARHPRSDFALSLFSRYVLLVQPDVRQSQVEATTLEETLLFLRFPKSRVRRHHTSATIPRTHSNRSFHVETSFEM